MLELLLKDYDYIKVLSELTISKKPFNALLEKTSVSKEKLEAIVKDISSSQLIFTTITLDADQSEHILSISDKVTKASRNLPAITSMFEDYGALLIYEFFCADMYNEAKRQFEIFNGVNESRDRLAEAQLTRPQLLKSLGSLVDKNVVAEYKKFNSILGSNECIDIKYELCASDFVDALGALRKEILNFVRLPKEDLPEEKEEEPLVSVYNTKENIAPEWRGFYEPIELYVEKLFNIHGPIRILNTINKNKELGQLTFTSAHNEDDGIAGSGFNVNLYIDTHHLYMKESYEGFRDITLFIDGKTIFEKGYRGVHPANMLPQTRGDLQLKCIQALQQLEVALESNPYTDKEIVLVTEERIKNYQAFIKAVEQVYEKEVGAPPNYEADFIECYWTFKAEQELKSGGQISIVRNDKLAHAELTLRTPTGLNLLINSDTYSSDKRSLDAAQQKLDELRATILQK